LSNFYTNEVGAETTLSWCQHGIPRKRFSELKQGKIPWDSKLDMHGLRADDAAQTLLDFIARHQTLDHRCLLIVHGKGNHRSEAPVLKNLVNHWLQQIPQVLAFHSALPREGGNGALYVLLKRNRGK
jgi:DNA-nicking Smr family endonuclease